MNEQMEFPETFEEFAKEYGFKDDKEVYTNGSDLIQIFRVKQWLEHDNKLRRIETDTAYECGKHANKWIPVSERLPYPWDERYLVSLAWGGIGVMEYKSTGFHNYGSFTPVPIESIIAWMPLPEPWKGERNEHLIDRQAVIDKDINVLSKDSIDRQAVLDCLTATNLKKFDFILDARDKIKNLPPVTPQPKTGHWILQPSNKEQGERDFIWWKCSECGQVIYSETEKDRREYHAFCGRCGAKMIEPQESEEV